MSNNLLKTIEKIVHLPQKEMSHFDQMSITAGVIWIAMAFSEGVDEIYKAVRDWARKQGFSVCEKLIKNNVETAHAICRDGESQSSAEPEMLDMYGLAEKKIPAFTA